MSEIENQSVPPPAAPPPPIAGTASAEERQWAMFAHLSALIGVVIPLGSVIAPLVIWQVKKNEMPFVDDQGKEALNFQITVALAAIVCLILFVVLIGMLLLPLLGIYWLVFTIMGGIKANNGETYRYPATIRLIK
jgi:hypothetical protein